MNPIYLDNASTSFPKAEGLSTTVANHLEHAAYNVSRGGYQASFDTAMKVIETRELVAHFFHATNSRNVLFTPNITTSLNMIIKGLLPANAYVITSNMEHNAVMRPLTQIKAKVDPAESPDEVNKKCQIRRPDAIIINHISNITGDPFDLEAIKQIAKDYGVPLIVDTAQSAGFQEIQMEGIDALAFTGHKGLLSTQGIGGFIITDELAQRVSPLLVGGTGSKSNQFEQPTMLPDKYEAGTLNIPGIIALQHSIQFIQKQGLSSIAHHEQSLAHLFESLLEPYQEHIKVIAKSPVPHRAPVVSLDFLKKDNSEVAHLLDRDHGIMTRCGLHCAPLAHQTMGTFPRGTVRFSFGFFNTKEQVEFAADAIRSVIL